MTWRIRIEPDARIDGVAIQIARKASDAGHLEVLRFQPRHELVQPGEAVISIPQPALSIDDDLGRALLDALAAYYGGTTGGQQQRADFVHERGRVDRLIAYLTRDDGGGAV